MTLTTAEVMDKMANKITDMFRACESCKNAIDIDMEKTYNERLNDFSMTEAALDNNAWVRELGNVVIRLISAHVNHKG